MAANTLAPTNTAKGTGSYILFVALEEKSVVPAVPAVRTAIEAEAHIQQALVELFGEEPDLELEQDQEQQDQEQEEPQAQAPINARTCSLQSLGGYKEPVPLAVRIATETEAHIQEALVELFGEEPDLELEQLTNQPHYRRLRKYSSHGKRSSPRRPAIPPAFHHHDATT